MSDDRVPKVSRRDLLALIGTVAGSTVMYEAMTALGFAGPSSYAGPLRLDGDPKGATVLVLGAGLAGLVAAMELRAAGYAVQVLEASTRAGGRCRTIRGGDHPTETDGVEQHCGFDDGLYFNPGPWRIPYHHRAMLDVCRRLGVVLEPFVQVNHNALLHAPDAFGGRPQRFREIRADFHGHVAELLAKCVRADQLDSPVSDEDKGLLLEALRGWGALDRRHFYAAGPDASERRGWLRDPGGGLAAIPAPSQPITLADILKSSLWRYLPIGDAYDFQATMVQPVGGMDAIARALLKDVADLVRFSAKVTAIRQDDDSVTVACEDGIDGSSFTATADWCICTLPLPILKGIDLAVGKPMADAISAIRYAASVKIGLQMKRRFWEDDEAIYGGITYTDLPISMIGYPSAGLGGAGKGILLGAYTSGGPAVAFGVLSPEERLKKAIEDGRRIHPQCAEAFETGVSVAWHRVPEALGGYALWSQGLRDRYYEALCAIDGRVMLAGEHVSYIPGWQEGAILSAFDAVSRLHRRVVAG